MPWPRPYLRRPLRRPRINRKPIFRSAPGGGGGGAPPPPKKGTGPQEPTPPHGFWGGGGAPGPPGGGGAPRAPAPWFCWGGGGAPPPPGPQKHRRPPWERCGLRFPPGPSSSATPPIPLRFPVPFRPIFSRNTPARNRCNFPASPRIPRAYPPFFFPPINRHTPKAFWKPAEGWFPGPSDSQPLEKHPSLALHPGSGPHPFRFTLPLRNFSGVWGRSRPQPGSRGAAAPGHAEPMPQTISRHPLSEFTPTPACIPKGSLFCGENNSY